MKHFCLHLSTAFLLALSLSAQPASQPSISSKTAGMKAFPGFFNFYWDEANGKIFLEIDKLDTEFLYVNSLPAGLGSNDIGLDRGQLGSQRIVFFQRIGKKVLLTQPNYQYRASAESATEQRAVQESFAQSVLWSFTVEAQDNSSKLLVDATDFLLRDAHQAADRIRSMRQGSYRADASRSAVYMPRTKNFPDNTEFEAIVTLTGSEAGNYVNSVTPSTEAITLRMHHSFIKLPDAGYKPRPFEARAGYFSVSWYDYSTPVGEPLEQRYIIRHRLQKKNPQAAMSEAVKPIVYYLDPGTPEPIRTALLEGAAWWNEAFEAAGFQNAFQVKMLPDDADPMDVRYNVIQWVHRSTRGWSYGASVVDPRTGEIIKGHVSLGSLRVRQDYLIAQGLLAPFEEGKPVSEEMLKMALNRLRQLSAHEVGHTLGIMHNYAASPRNRASVMDYPHPLININAQGELDFSQAYDLKIGEWDKLAVRYGYSEFPAGEETAQLRALLDQAEDQGVPFIADRDARAAGGAHPTAHLWDNGSKAYEELKAVMQVRRLALKRFSENNIEMYSPMATLEDVLVPVYNYHRYQAEAAVKLIGGLEYHYAVRRPGKNFTTRLVPLSEQRMALEALLQAISAEELALPEKIIALIPPRPAGMSYHREMFPRRTGLTLDPLAPAEAFSDFVISLLVHPERASRMVEQQARFGQNTLGLDDLLNTLVNNTWKAARAQGLVRQIQLQNEQILLSHLMVLSLHDNASYQAKAYAFKALQDIKQLAESRLKTNTDPDLVAHYQYTLERMKAPDKVKVSVHKDMPPGAPIGSCDAAHYLTY